ncbi:MAG: hypothetical protein WCF90_07270 [Methanomicrobiales archaeon]
MAIMDKLRGIIPEKKLHGISDHFEGIGDITIISIPQGLSDYKPVIARELTSRRRNHSTVRNKVAKVSGNGRIAGYKILTSITTVTLHHEFGFAYRLDVTSVFFNTRLACVRKRGTNLTTCGERVIYCFAESDLRYSSDSQWGTLGSG